MRKSQKCQHRLESLEFYPSKYCAVKSPCKKKAAEECFSSLKSSVTDKNAQDFSGYTRRTRESEQNVKAKSKIYYQPLINKTPVDPPATYQQWAV